MREWRTLEQDRDARGEADALRVEAWALGVSMVVIVLAYLFPGLHL